MPSILYATFDDIAMVYEGAIPSTDRPRLETLLRRASARLTRIMPSVPHRIQTGELDPDLPAGLVVEAVLRVYRNPEGVTQQAIGPFHKEFNPREVASEITFDEKEITQLLAPIPNYTRPAIRVGFPTRRQILQDVGGTDWPPDPQVPADRLALADGCTVVKTP